MTPGNETDDASPTRFNAIKRYVRLKERILQCIEDMTALAPDSEAPYEELREKIETNTFNLVVVGQFKRGKTCLINALLGADILPVAVVPLTSIVTILTFGQELSVEVSFLDGTALEVDPKQLADYVTETGNPKNAKGVREVVIRFPSPYLKDGVRLLDTPGVGSVYLHNTDVAYRYLPKSDAALFLLSVEQPVGRAELDFLRDVQEYSDRIFFLLNKIDYLSDEEIEASVAFSKEALLEVMGSEVKIFPISAKLALNGKLHESDEFLSRSRLPAFSEILSDFLFHEKGKVLLISASNSLLKSLAQERLRIDLERRSLEIPIEELREKIALFEEKKREILSERESLDVLLEGELNRLIKDRLNKDVAVFKKQLTSQMESSFDLFYSENKHLSLKELNDSLEAHVVNEVERAFSAWSAKEHDQLAEAYDAIFSRVVGRIDDILNDLVRFSSQLFAVPLEDDAAEVHWMADSHFTYKFSGDAVGLDILADSLTQVIPGFIGSRFKKIKAYFFKVANRVILSKRRQHMLETIDMQGGRIRFVFAEKLKKSQLSFRRAMLKRIQWTVDGMGMAIDEGVKQRSQSEMELAETQKRLTRKTEKLNQLKDELAAIRESALGI